MNTNINGKDSKTETPMPGAEEVARELASAQSMDDFFGKEGIFARLFARTLEQMLDAELTAHLGYEPYEAKGRNSGNSRNGRYSKKVRTSAGDTKVEAPRDRKGEYEPQVLRKYASNTSELEEKIIGMYARGMSTRDIQDMLEEMYGVDISATTISTVTTCSRAISTRSPHPSTTLACQTRPITSTSISGACTIKSSVSKAIRLALAQSRAASNSSRHA